MGNVLFQHCADDHRRNGRHHQFGEQGAGGGVFRRVAEPQHATRHHQPFHIEIRNQPNGCAQMQHDQEGQEAGRVLIDAPMQHGRNDDRMAERADGEQLRRPLKNGEQNGMHEIHEISFALWRGTESCPMCCIAEFSFAVKSRPMSEVISESVPSRPMVGLLAASCGIVVANIYYSQPLVGLIGPALHMGARGESLIVSLTQLGYAAGLIFLVPLGDLVENRRLVVATIVAAILPLVLAGLAWNAPMMLVVSALIGLTSVSVQMLIPLAAHLTPEARRGRVVGLVTSGLLFGILFSRPASSVIASLGSWRTVFFISAALMAGMALLLSRTLPYRKPAANHHYGELLVSLFTLPVRFPVLRQRAAYQSACFAGFSLFWTAAPLYLAHAFGFTQRGIALFALAGAAGAFAAPMAGHLADRGHTKVGTFGALVGVMVAFGIAAIGAVLHSVLVLAFAGIVLDAAVQTSLVLGQRSIYILAPELRSRMNGIFMAIFFFGGAAGSAVTGLLLTHTGWSGLCAAGALLPLLALVYFLSSLRG